MTGAEQIATERQRQIDDEGYTPEHDDEHEDGSLAMAAICYAAPTKVYRFSDDFAQLLQFRDPWPWTIPHDRRYRMGERRENPGNVLPDPDTYTDAERMELLVKAGALIAAEIDRIERRQEAGKGFEF